MVKRPIDHQRDSAFYFDVGGVDDTSPVTGFFKIGNKTFMALKANAIYEITLPDDIDPGRTNPNLKPMEQKVSPYGTNDEIVCKILLTAERLFSRTFLGDEFDSERALELSLEELKDINAMRQILEKLSHDQNEAWDKFLKHQSLNEQSTRLPSIPDVEARLEAFLQKAKHAISCLEQIAKLFLPKELNTRWIQNLSRIAAEKHGSDSAFSEFMKAAEPLLLKVIELRNVIEHPKQNARIVVYDFTMDEKGQVTAPTFELITPNTPSGDRSGIALYMDHIIQHLAAISEALMVNLCALNVKKLGAFDICVAEIPELRRRNNVRFGYWAFIGDQWVPYG